MHLRQSIRSLRNSPGFTLAAVAILAVGIGATSAIFSFVHALLLRPLPFSSPDRLVRIESLQGGVTGKLMPREWEELDRDRATFDGVAGWYPSQYNMSADGRPEVVRACMTTANLFRVLGVHLPLGSAWQEGTHRERNPVVILSHELWKNRLGAREPIVRQTLTLDFAPYMVVGVAPEGFHFPTRNDVYRAAHLGGAQNNDVRSLFVVARLREGISIHLAQSRLQAFATEQARQFPSTNRDVAFRVTPLRDAYVGEIRPWLLLTLVLVSVVLLIACSNVVNLMLARGVARVREFAIRAALGAERGQIVRQLVAESMLLNLTGGLLGVAVAWASVRALRELLRADLPPWMDVQVDVPVLLFSLAVSVVCGLAAGLYPALAASRTDTQTALREGSRGAGGSKAQARIRQGMIAGELALAVALLIAAGLLARSFSTLQSADAGFTRTGLITFRTDPPWSRHNKAEHTSVFYRVAQQKLESIPGVTAVAANHSFPLALNQNYGKPTIVVEGQTEDEQRLNPFVNVQIVSANYFTVLGIPILAGRAFTLDDRLSTPPALVISRPLASRLFGDASPVGRRVRLPELLGSLDEKAIGWFTIVGVAEGVRSESLTGSPGMDLYVSNQQQFAGDTFFILRTALPLSSVATLAQAAIREADPEQPIFAVRSVAEIVEETVWQRRIAGQLSMSFGAVALLLAAIGTYSLVAWSVSQRRWELALRQALGSTPQQVRRLVLGEGLRLTAIGVPLGIAIVLPAAAAASRLLYGVRPWDPAIVAGSVASVIAFALIACFVPAWRASRIQPNDALKNE